MKVQKIKISELKENPNNTRIHTRRNLETLKQSLTEFGQTKPIIVNKNGMYVVAGNGTLQAAIALGWEDIECNLVDLDDNKAKALSIIDNKTSDLSQNDEKMLTEALSELKEIDISLFDLTGFKEDELERMLSFQEGTLFNDVEKKAEKAKKKEKKEKIEEDLSVGSSPSYSDQITCVVFGYPFVLTDKEEVLEIKNLFEFVKDAEKEKQIEIEKDFFNSIKELLTRHFLT